MRGEVVGEESSRGLDVRSGIGDLSIEEADGARAERSTSALRCGAQLAKAGQNLVAAAFACTAPRDSLILDVQPCDRILHSPSNPGVRLRV